MAVRLTDAHIGRLVKRDAARDRWHRIESVIAGAAVTNCGRRLEPRDERGRELVTSSGEPTCEECRA